MLLPDRQVYPLVFEHSRSIRTIVIMDIRQKLLTPRERLSRSLKVIGTDMDRSATYHFLLLIHSKHRTVSDVSKKLS